MCVLSFYLYRSVHHHAANNLSLVGLLSLPSLSITDHRGYIRPHRCRARLRHLWTDGTPLRANKRTWLFNFHSRSSSLWEYCLSHTLATTPWLFYCRVNWKTPWMWSAVKDCKLSQSPLMHQVQPSVSKQIKPTRHTNVSVGCIASREQEKKNRFAGACWSYSKNNSRAVWCCAAFSAFRSII